ncbi:hypothetical protein GGP41_008577 [Bipolaris sorokiniana]|uniref:Uncharacterized protein n=1 Tax=Cochliobolus sativus TaxID=45130 RepID=A0A8H5ZBF1_COCSA|nr:hypothetical protein GGP41_008577 [Bipolaris sorokiniana]
MHLAIQTTCLPKAIARVTPAMRNQGSWERLGDAESIHGIQETLKGSSGSSPPIPIVAALWSSSTTTTQSDDRHIVVVNFARGQPFPLAATPRHCEIFFSRYPVWITTRLLEEKFALDHMLERSPEGPNRNLE